MAHLLSPALAHGEVPSADCRKRSCWCPHALAPMFFYIWSSQLEGPCPLEEPSARADAA